MVAFVVEKKKSGLKFENQRPILLDSRVSVAQIKAIGLLLCNPYDVILRFSSKLRA